MRAFVFVFVSDESTIDFKEGLSIQPSVLILASDYQTALFDLAKHRHDLGLGSNDPGDYQADIDDGNIEVCIPVTPTPLSPPV